MSTPTSIAATPCAGTDSPASIVAGSVRHMYFTPRLRGVAYPVRATVIERTDWRPGFGGTYWRATLLAVSPADHPYAARVGCIYTRRAAMLAHIRAALVAAHQ